MLVNKRRFWQVLRLECGGWGAGLVSTRDPPNLAYRAVFTSSWKGSSKLELFSGSISNFVVQISKQGTKKVLKTSSVLKLYHENLELTFLEVLIWNFPSTNLSFTSASRMKQRLQSTKLMRPSTLAGTRRLTTTRYPTRTRGSTTTGGGLHQQPAVNCLPRFSPQLISLERYMNRAGEIDLFENLDIVPTRLLVAPFTLNPKPEISNPRP